MWHLHLFVFAHFLCTAVSLFLTPSWTTDADLIRWRFHSCDQTFFLTHIRTLALTGIIQQVDTFEPDQTQKYPTYFGLF